MVDKWLEDLKELKCLSEEDLKKLCEKAKEIFIEAKCECSSLYMW